MKDKKVWISGLCGALIGAGFMYLGLNFTGGAGPSGQTKKPVISNPMVAGMQQSNPQIQDEEEQDPFAGFGLFGQLPQLAGMVMDGPELEEREDASNIYYDLKFSGQDGSKVEAAVQGNQVVVSGVMKNSQNRGVANFVSESSFQRIFPVPQGVDGSKMEILNEPGKVTLKFPKVR